MSERSETNVRCNDWLAGNGKTVCWFSCGAASAVAAKLALEQCPDAVVARQDTGSEHPDNERFMRDCEEWFGKEVVVLKSPDFLDTWDVWESRRYIAGVSGAPCTSELKRKVAERFLFDELGIGTTEVLGYTAEEQGRMTRWQQNNPERKLWPILIERGLTKDDCLGIIDRAGIEIPEMYKLGFRNNNCIACPKATAHSYWGRVRRHFPDQFTRMARLERELDAAICKTEPIVDGVRQRIRVFLDELPDEIPEGPEPSISCGLFCMGVADEVAA